MSPRRHAAPQVRGRTGYAAGMTAGRSAIVLVGGVGCGRSTIVLGSMATGSGTGANGAGNTASLADGASGRNSGICGRGSAIRIGNGAGTGRGATATGCRAMESGTGAGRAGNSVSLAGAASGGTSIIWTGSARRNGEASTSGSGLSAARRLVSNGAVRPEGAGGSGRASITTPGGSSGSAMTESMARGRGEEAHDAIRRIVARATGTLTLSFPRYPESVELLIS